MSIHIEINGRPFDVYPLDEETTLVQRYSQSVPDSLPEYFRIVDSGYTLAPGLQLRVEDVRDSAEMKSSDTPQKSTMAYIQEAFNISSKTFLLLWLRTHRPTIDDTLTQALRNLNRDFFSSRAIEDMMKEYSRQVKDARGRMKESLSEISKLMKSLSEKKRVNVDDDLTIEAYSSYMVWDVPDNDLLDVFNALDVSDSLPYIALKTPARLVFKVHDQFAPPEEWTDDVVEDKRFGIYMKVLEQPYRETYTDVFWSTDHVIDLEYHPNQERTEDSLWGQIELAVGHRVRYTKITKPRHRRIKALFNVLGVTLNKGVFFDLVMNDPLVKEFLFLREGEHSAMTKAQIFAYYQFGKRSALTFRMIPDSFETEKGKVVSKVLIRAAEASNVQQVEVLKQALSRVFYIYLQRYDEIVAEYQHILPNFLTLSPDAGKGQDVPVNLKVKDKLFALQQNLPELFLTSNYPKLCSAEKQPVILKDDEVIPWITETKGERDLDYGFFHVIRYPMYGPYARWYACDGSGYPAIKENKGANADVFPYVPCCGATNYRDKTTPLYRLYLEQLEEEAEGGETPVVTQFIEALKKNGIVIGRKKGEIKRKKTIGYIVQAKTVAEPGRWGFLPHNLHEMAVRAGVDTFTEGQKEHFRLLRLGVEMEPDSFLYCVKVATDPSFRVLSEDKRRKRVYKLRTEMASGTFEAGKQEMYDLSDDTIKAVLGTEGRYLDPKMWVSFVASYFRVNIFLYQWDDKHYHGKIVVPRNGKVYLYPGIDYDRNTVFIIMYPMQRYPYQCNLLIHRGRDNHDLTYVFDTALVAEADRVFRDSYKVLYMDLNVVNTIRVGEVTIPKARILKYEEAPSQLLSGAKSQYVDDYGKVRMVNYDGVSLMTPPMAPIEALPMAKAVPVRADVETAQKFVAANDLLILAQDGDGDQAQGLWVRLSDNLGYIPLKITKGLPSVPFASENDPMRTWSVSELAVVRHDRRVAYLLKQYVLHMYSRGTYHETDSYVVREGHVYDLSRLSRRVDDNRQTLFEGERLIVPSDSVRQRLHSYLQIELLNNKTGVERLKEERFLGGYYQTVLDFRPSPGQVIFIGLEDLQRWTSEKECRAKTAKVHYEVQPMTRNAYFYINYKLTNRIFIIQNVERGALDRALSVSYKWKRDQVNLGYNAEVNPAVKDVAYNVYTQDGILRRAGSVEEALSVIQYSADQFAALLWLT